jgi:FkbM family methyltransferase
MRMFLDTAAKRIAAALPDRAFVAAIGGLYTRFEPELRRLAQLAPPGGTAVDVGAWYGPWSRRLAQHATQVVALEPAPRAADVLRRTAPANVRVIEAAASDTNGEAQLWLPPQDGGAEGVSSLTPSERNTRRLTVPTVTLDSLGLTDVTFIKIDVEGHELPVLRGAETTVLRDQPNLFIELEVRMQPIAPAVELLAGWGYRAWVLPGDEWIPLSSFDLETHQQNTGHVAADGFLRRSLWPRPRYVNSVLFQPEHRPPPGA